MKIIKQNLSNGKLAIGLIGNPAEIQQEFDAMYNWNVAGRERASFFDTRLHEDQPLSFGYDGFIYFYTTESRLRRGMIGRLANKALNQGLGRKGAKGGVKSMAMQAFVRFEQQMEEKAFLQLR